MGGVKEGDVTVDEMEEGVRVAFESGDGGLGNFDDLG